MRICALYLAAGSSRRMGYPKLMAQLAPGISLGAAALGNVAACGVSSVAVAVRPDDPLEWLGKLPAWPPVSIVRCPDAASGMAESLKSGLQSLLPQEPDAVLIALADQPFVSLQWLKDLIRLFAEGAPVDYAASGCGEALMPPAVLSRSMCGAIAGRLRGDRGAGAFFASGEFAGRGLRETEIRELMDVDDPAGLELARARWIMAGSGNNGMRKDGGGT